MKDIVIFEDGKSARGSRAKLVKRDHHRVLIQFIKCDWDADVEELVTELVTEWFTLFIPSWSEDKKSYKHNNKRKFAKYYHKETNEFYSDYYQTDSYREEVKGFFADEYYVELFGVVGGDL